SSTGSSSNGSSSATSSPGAGRSRRMARSSRAIFRSWARVRRGAREVTTMSSPTNSPLAPSRMRMVRRNLPRRRVTLPVKTPWASSRRATFDTPSALALNPFTLRAARVNCFWLMTRALRLSTLTTPDWKRDARGPLNSSTAIRFFFWAWAAGANATSARPSATRTAAQRRARLLAEPFDLELTTLSSFRRGGRATAGGAGLGLPLLAARAAGHAAEQKGEVGRAGRVANRLLVGDQARLDEVGQRLVEGDHAVGVQALRDGVLDLAGAHRVLDHLPHPLGVDHDLEPRDHALAVGARDQPLRDHAAQHRGQAEARLHLLVGGEHRDDAVDGLGGVHRVQGGEDQMPGLRRCDGDLGGLDVAHLADQDDVRVLAQGGAQGAGERLGVEPDLALVDDRALVAERVLDRVLDRDDVAGLPLVDVVHHGGQRGRLAGAGDAGDQHHAALVVRQVEDGLGQVEALERGHLGRDEAQ